VCPNRCHRAACLACAARHRLNRTSPPLVKLALAVADSSHWDARGRRRGRHGDRGVDLDVRRPSPSPEDHQCTVAAWTEPAASELALPAAPLQYLAVPLPTPPW
jgi:hypothetical protein